MASDPEEYFHDKWPWMPDGSAWDGTDLLSLARGDQRPFANRWDVNLLFQELEERLGSKVVDVPAVDKGSNKYVSHVLA